MMDRHRNSVHVERLGPARLRVVVDAPLSPPGTGDRHADIAALTTDINATLQRWVRARPEQWLWLHRRWPKESTP
jgi:KDO2-lipid IV(A) lauroyltransferase